MILLKLKCFLNHNVKYAESRVFLKLYDGVCWTNGNRRLASSDIISKYKTKRRRLYVALSVSFMAISPWVLKSIGVTERNDVRIDTVDWKVTYYSAVPLRPLSRTWGWLTERRLPVWTRYWVFKTYALIFGCNLDEAASEDLTSYDCFADFFSRSLKDGARPVDTSECIVSPADGTVLNYGVLTCSDVEQVKGVTYSLESFIGDLDWIQPRKNEISSSYCDNLRLNKDTSLYQYIIYLAPGDYHKFHSPVDWKIYFRRHFQGRLFSVNPKIAGVIPNLFCLNERVTYSGEWKYGFFSLTAIGATNVGSIRVFFDPVLRTNRWRLFSKTSTPLDLSFVNNDSNGIEIRKGDMFGEFRLGSTIVLIFEAPKNLGFQISAGQKIHVGQALSEVL